jgi:5-methylthioadenosine/S-adenosylhomocysteine deaminase
MEPIDTLINARWIIPIEPLGRVLNSHAVAIRAGRIIAIGPAADLAARFEAREIIHRPGHVLLPGFVNAHTHAAMSLLRGAAESASFERWLRTQVWPLEQRWVDAEYVRDGTELAMADMITSGTTCFGDMHLYPEVVAQATSGAQMRACIGLPVFEQPTSWAESAGECLEKGLRLHDDYRDDPLVTTCLSPYAPWALGDETLIRVRRAADELELPMTMHVNETPEDATANGERTIARLERLGLLSPLLAAVHMIHLDETDLEAVARAGSNIVHCPQSNLKLGNGISPVARFKARDMNVGIGTNGAASNNDLSMLDELRTGALLARGVPSAHVTIEAHEWLRFATLNSARALGLGEMIGSLTPGKWADLCCIDLHRAHTQPVYDPAAQLVFAASREQVSDVWVAGKALLSDFRLTRIDIEDVLARAERWRERIGSSVGRA